MVHFYGRMEVT